MNNHHLLKLGEVYGSHFSTEPESRFGSGRFSKTFVKD
jgi:hypothetical protein